MEHPSEVHVCVQGVGLLDLVCLTLIVGIELARCQNSLTWIVTIELVLCLKCLLCLSDSWWMDETILDCYCCCWHGRRCLMQTQNCVETPRRCDSISYRDVKWFLDGVWWYCFLKDEGDWVLRMVCPTTSGRRGLNQFQKWIMRHGPFYWLASQLFEAVSNCAWHSKIYVCYLIQFRLQDIYRSQIIQ